MHNMIKLIFQNYLKGIVIAKKEWESILTDMISVAQRPKYQYLG